MCSILVNFINFLYEHRFSSFFYVHVTREKLPKRRSYEKFVRKMLMKLTPGHKTFWPLNSFMMDTIVKIDSINRSLCLYHIL